MNGLDYMLLDTGKLIHKHGNEQWDYKLVVRQTSLLVKNDPAYYA